MLKNLVVFLAFGFASIANAGLINANDDVTVDLELQLLVDVSGSISAEEYSLQTQGYAAAFRDTDVLDAIFSGATQSIAVQYIEWSGFSEQQIQVDWFLIDSVASAAAFADLILGLDIPSEAHRAFGLIDPVTGLRKGATAIGRAIRYGADLFDNNIESARQVMDISGDGVNNSGSGANSTPDTQRDRALSMGVDQINAIVIGDNTVADHYRDNVIGGDDSFMISIPEMNQFETGIKQKLSQEIRATQVPEPSTGIMIALAGAALLASRRKKA